MEDNGQFRAIVRRWTRTALLVVVVAAPAAASWHGLVAFGTGTLGLSAGWAVVVPVSLDGAALYCAALAMASVLRGDSALTPRLLTVVYAVASAVFNAVNAIHEREPVQAALFFGGAALSAAVLWDVTLRALRRDQLRELGAIEAPLPRFRATRWLVAPIETAQAWRLAVINGLTSPDAALQAVRVKSQYKAYVDTFLGTDNGGSDECGTGSEDGWSDQEAVLDRGSAGDPVRGAGVDAGRPGSSSTVGGAFDRDGHRRVQAVHDVPESAGAEHPYAVATICGAVARGERDKADAVRAAFDQLGERNIPAGRRLLEQHGLEVDRSYAYTVRWQPTPAPRAELTVIGGDR